MQPASAVPSASSPCVLYNYSFSGNGYKCALLAALLKIPIEVIDVNLRAGEHKSESFLTINPKGEVPVLLDGDKKLTDSAGILVYLASKHDSTMWSKDPYEQGLITEWLAFAASYIQFGVFTARAIVSFNMAGNTLGTNFNRDSALAEAKIRSSRSLEVLNDQLGKNEWLALGRLTIADIAVFPYVALCYQGEVSLDPYPNVQKWINRIKALPDFISMPGLDQ